MQHREPTLSELADGLDGLCTDTILVVVRSEWALKCARHDVLPEILAGVFDARRSFYQGLDVAAVFSVDPITRSAAITALVRECAQWARQETARRLPGDQ
jgi:hypothetical protein